MLPGGADEVRSLAQRTQKSTQEIQEMISRLQSGVQEAVQVMAQGKVFSDITLEHTHRVNAVLHELTQAVKKINKMNENVAQVTNQQARFSEDIDKNVMNINIFFETTAREIEHAMDACSELAQLSETIRTLIHRFKVEL
jgi:methyl-accepting chemotaxis protein